MLANGPKLSKHPAFDLSQAPLTGKEVIVIEPPSPPQKPIIETYQTMVVGLLTFVIGLLTVINAITSTYINSKNRAQDLKAKRTAFFAIFASDADLNIESLKKTSEILSSLDETAAGSQMWINGIRIASRISIQNPLNIDWEKLSILKPNEIVELRRLQNRFSEVSSLFSSILDDPNPTRAQGALPLFEGRTSEDDTGGGIDRLSLIFDDLTEAVREGLIEATKVRDQFRSLIGG